MLPVHPPLPTAWSFPFHPETGNHTSILISELFVGVTVAVTRQNAGKSWATSRAGDPAGTACARVIVVSESFNDARLSHGAVACAATFNRSATAAVNMIAVTLRQKTGCVNIIEAP